MTYGITDLATFILGTIFIVLLPGPNSMYVTLVASRWGIAAGYRGACGIFLGDLILMILAASGVASLLVAVPALFMVLEYAGGACLVWLGIGLLRAAVQRGRGIEAPASRLSEGDARQPFRTALVISLMNPKAILFFTAVLPPFLDINRPLAPQLALFAATTIGMDGLSMCAYGLGGAALARQMTAPRFRKGFGIVVGCLLLLAAVLIVSRL